MEDNKGIREEKNHVLRKEGDKYFIYFGENYPDRAMYDKLGLLGRDYSSDFRAWFLSREQKGNKVEVAKSDEGTFISQFCQEWWDGTDDELEEKLSAGIPIPLCYEVRRVNEQDDPKHWMPSETHNYEVRAYFKEPENDGRTNDFRVAKQPRKRVTPPEPEVFKFLRSEDKTFSMWTASNNTYPLIGWMEKMKRFANGYSDLVNGSLKEENEKLKALVYSHVVSSHGRKTWQDVALDLGRKWADEVVKNKEHQQEIERLRGDLALANGSRVNDPTAYTEYDVKLFVSELLFKMMPPNENELPNNFTGTDVVEAIEFGMKKQENTERRVYQRAVKELDEYFETFKKENNGKK